jgi:hypothetical protein
VEHAIEAFVHLAEPLSRVRAAVTRDVGVLVASATTDDGGGRARFQTSLAIEIGAGTQVQQAIVGELGPLSRTEDALVVAARWEPVSHTHLLPAFAGAFELTADPPGTRLLLRGSYTVPLGPAGRVADWAAGRRLAKRVLTGHLDAVAVRLHAELLHAAPSEQEPSVPGSEYYLG